MNYLYPFLVASLSTLVLCLIATKLFPVLGLMDKPEKYGLKRRPIPYSVGLLLYIVFTVTILVFLPIEEYPSVIGVIAGAGLIVLVSFIDDFKPLPPLLRLCVQVIAGLIVIYSGIGIHSISNPFGVPFSLDRFITLIEAPDSWLSPFFPKGGFEIIWLADIFTLVWIIILVNSVNWLDGINGLASGVGLIAAFALFFLSSRPGFHMIDQEPVIIMSITLAGVFLVFFAFNFYPAAMLM